MNRTVECYDPTKNEWRFVAPMKNQRDGACVVTEGRYIYVISGYDGHNYLSSVEVYDPSTDEWALGGKHGFVLPVTNNIHIDLSKSMAGNYRFG